MYEDFETIDDTSPRETILRNVREKVERLRKSPELYPEHLCEENLLEWYKNKYPEINFIKDIYENNNLCICEDVNVIMREEIKNEILKSNSFLRYTNLSKYQQFIFDLCLSRIEKMAETTWNPLIKK